MQLTTETVKAALKLWARHLKNPPQLTDEMATDWRLIFDSEIPDQTFKSLAVAALRTLTWFPAPAEFAALMETGLDERAELAWLHVKRRGGNIKTPADVGGEPCALWAAASLGKHALESLRHHPSDPFNERELKKDFLLLYKLAWRRGLGLETYSGKRPELPQSQISRNQQLPEHV
jgi:hypothetical protein